MSDLISRQVAIDAMCELMNSWFGGDPKDEQEEIKWIINHLPSAQPERKKGKWIEQDDGWDGVYYECSECGEAFTLIDGTPTDNLYNFCPNCGSYNGGDNNVNEGQKR